MVNLFNIVNHILTAKFIVPKVYKFQNVHSIAEIMDVIYEKSVRCISVLFWILLCFSKVIMQILVISILLKDLLGTNYLETLICSMLLMVLYSAFRGITCNYHYWYFSAYHNSDCNLMSLWKTVLDSDALKRLKSLLKHFLAISLQVAKLNLICCKEYFSIYLDRI